MRRRPLFVIMLVALLGIGLMYGGFLMTNAQVCEAQNEHRDEHVDEAREDRDEALGDPRIAAAFPELTPEEFETLVRESYQRKKAAHAPIDCFP